MTLDAIHHGLVAALQWGLLVVLAAFTLLAYPLLEE